ncbi:DUF3567 family protein [bacterium]|nr:MAG: DUF3567 family protein [bacterium]
MNMIYNSAHYYVLEYDVQSGHDTLGCGAYEIADKAAQREALLYGKLACRFREQARQLAEVEATQDEIDDFLGQFDGLMGQSVTLQ